MPDTNYLLLQMPSPVMVMTGPDFIITLANSPMLQLLGKPFGDVLQQQYFQLFPDQEPELRNLYQEVLESGRVLVQDEVYFPDQEGDPSTELCYKFVLTPVTNGADVPEGIMVSAHDITVEVRRRKMAEQNQDHLNTLLSRIAAGVVQISLEGKVLEANEKFCQLLGYSRKELLHVELLSLVHPEERAQTKSMLAQCAAGHGEFKVEKRLRRKNGTYLWVSNSMLLIRNPGVPPFITEVCLDIHQQRETLAQLNETIKEVSDYKFALDKSAIVAITDQKGVIQYVNENFSNISGYSAAELIGQDHRIINSEYHPKPFIRELWQTIARGKIWKGEIRNRAKNGRYYWVDTTIVPFLNTAGKPYQYVAIRSDITQRKLAEDSIRESEERYATVVEASDLGLWDFDVVRKKIVAAGRMAAIYGLKANEDYTLDRVMACVYPDDRAEQDRLLQSIITGKVSTNFETEFRIIDQTTGQVKWLRARARAFFDEQGNLYRTVGTAANITAHKEAQVQLQESEERLNLVVDAAGLGMWDYNILADTAVLSERTRAYYGLAPDEIFSFERFLAAVHPDDRAFVARGNQEVLFGSGGNSTYIAEFRIVHANGMVRWNRSLGRVLRNEKGERYRFIGAIVDITEEKEAAEALLRREQEFRSLAENAPDIIARHDRDLRFIYANPQIESVLGIAPKDLLGRRFRDLDVPRSLSRFMEAQLSIALAQKKTHSVEYPSVDGKSWVYSRWVPELDAGGEVAAILVITTDVTNLKRVELALRDSEIRFRTMANSIPQLAWMTDEKGRIYWYNQRWFDYTGTTLEEMNAYGWELVHHPSMVQGVTERINKAFETGSDWEDTFLLRGRDGQFRWFLSRAVLVHKEDGSIQGWFGTHTDVTEQRQTEEALQLAKDQLELTFQNVPSAIYLVDRQGKLLYLNEQAALAMGFGSVGAAMAQPSIFAIRDKMDQMFDARSEAGTPMKVEDGSMGIALQTKRHASVVTQLVNRQTGDVRWVYSHSAPLFNPNGELRMVLTSTTDITDQRMFTEKLEQEVERRTRELQRSNEDLQQFAHAASHDLKEPVRKVLTFLDRVIKDHGDQLPEKARYYLDRVEVAARRSYAMIDGLLYYSKVDAAVNIKEDLDLEGLLRQIEHDLELPIQQKQAHIEYGRLPHLTGAPELVYQLFYNLFTNALKFVHPDRTPEIEVCAHPGESEDGRVTIYVADNGIGFSTEHAETIFHIYTRLHSKDVYEGSGLGLTLCRRIVERHGGTIKAEGKKGEGAKFTIVFPGRWRNY